MNQHADISPDLLFAVPETLSPRLAWMKKHGIITFNLKPHGLPDTWLAGFQDWWPDLRGWEFFAEETAHNGDTRCCEADTEHDALADLARFNGLKLWNEEAE